ncbi:MAG: NERD domain-containing protein [Clostridia bacterium]|nr:NERD domain-containing protein [Clostridia bacterium]MDD4049346.1 NERD domain-containing protein [Clostridia bacterium]
MIINESGLEFAFTTENVIKFDDSEFFRHKYQVLQDGKGVDFLVFHNKTLWLIEVKNFTGHETEGKTRKRLGVRNKEVESLDIEVALKVRSTLACLVGAGTKKDEVLKNYSKRLTDIILQDSDKLKLKVILFLEGEFSTDIRNEAKTFSFIQKSIKNNLRWLDVEVHIENTRLRRFDKIYNVS